MPLSGFIRRGANGAFFFRSYIRRKKIIQRDLSPRKTQDATLYTAPVLRIIRITSLWSHCWNFMIALTAAAAAATAVAFKMRKQCPRAAWCLPINGPGYIGNLIFPVGVMGTRSAVCVQSRLELLATNNTILTRCSVLIKSNCADPAIKHAGHPKKGQRCPLGLQGISFVIRFIHIYYNRI